MPVLDLDGLTRYDGNIKNYIGRFANWQKSEKAGAVTCWPVGGTQLKPSVDFLFTETPPAEGDKSPSNPSTITGVSSVKVTRCGKNLIPQYPDTTEHTVGGVKYKYNGDGSYTINGTADGSNSLFYIRSTGMGGIRLHSGETYTLSGALSSSVRLCTHVEGSDKYDLGTGLTFTAASDSIANCFIMVTNGTTVNNLIIKPQYELGSTATSFEPYEGADYTVNLGGTCYGGTVDLATGVMTVTHTGTTLNGDTYFSTGVFEELADVYVVGFYPSPERLKPLASFSDAACSILPVAIGTGAKNYPCAYLADNAISIRLQFSKASLSLGDGVDAGAVRTAVHALLAQHPGFIVWPVATPTTVQLSPTEILSLTQTDKYTPRCNTVYSDQTSVKVGYAKSPIRSEYELTQAIIATEGGE